jgi:hypothetical protein
LGRQVPILEVMSTSAENEKKSPRSFRIPLALLIGVIVYILSVGPVTTTVMRLGWGMQLYRPVRAFYAPVFAIARSSEFVMRAYEGYVGFWCRLILKQDFPKYRPNPPLERLITSIGSITKGQTAFQIFVPTKLSRGGDPIGQDVALAEIIGKVREHGLYPAGFQQQPGGRLYTFERVREWERKKQ